MKLILPLFLAAASFATFAAADSNPMVTSAQQILPGEGAPVLKCTSPSGNPEVCKVRIFHPGQAPVAIDMVKNEVIAVDGAVVTCVGCSKV